MLIEVAPYSIKKPKTHRYPSLKGTDPKFRRNHRHALHGTMRALVCGLTWSHGRCVASGDNSLTHSVERGQGGQARCGIRMVPLKTTQIHVAASLTSPLLGKTRRH